MTDAKELLELADRLGDIHECHFEVCAACRASMVRAPQAIRQAVKDKVVLDALIKEHETHTALLGSADEKLKVFDVHLMYKAYQEAQAAIDVRDKE